MARLRVYELARQLEMDTRDLMKELKELGIEVKSHMSYIDEETVNLLLEMYSEEDELEDELIYEEYEEEVEKEIKRKSKEFVEKSEVVKKKKGVIKLEEEDLKLDKFAQKIGIPQNRIIQDFFMKGEILKPGQTLNLQLAKKNCKNI